MAWFDDKRLKDIYEGRVTAGVSSEDYVTLRRSIELLRNTREVRSHWIAGKPLPGLGGRHAIQVTKGWAISFDWIEGVGPLRMRLERLGD